MKKEYCNTLINYITAIENPDSAGWDEKTQTWGEPHEPGFDKNQRGIGLDIKKNQKLAKFLKDNPRKGNYITKDEEERFRYQFIDYLEDVFKRNASGLKVSEKKKIMAMGLMYHGYGRNLWNDYKDGLYDAFWNGDDNAFKEAISQFYTGKFTERKNNHEKFWKEYDLVHSALPAKKQPKIRPIPIVHHEQPDALKVVRPTMPIKITKHKFGGTQMLNYGAPRFPIVRLSSILNSIKNFRFRT